MFDKDKILAAFFVVLIMAGLWLVIYALFIFTFWLIFDYAIKWREFWGIYLLLLLMFSIAGALSHEN
jgi:hypothetical protein